MASFCRTAAGNRVDGFAKKEVGCGVDLETHICSEAPWIIKFGYLCMQEIPPSVRAFMLADAKCYTY